VYFHLNLNTTCPTPQIGENVFIADYAVIAGDVIIGNDSSVWFHAVIRGDVNSIRIGNKVNIQDGAIIHCTFEKTKTIIGDNVSIGHRAIVHGATVGDNVLIGMGAIVMDNAIIPSNVIIGAGSLVLEGSVLESGFVYAGVPAKKIKQLSDDLFADQVKRIADNYIKYSSWFKINTL